MKALGALNVLCFSFLSIAFFCILFLSATAGADPDATNANFWRDLQSNNILVDQHATSGDETLCGPAAGFDLVQGLAVATGHKPFLTDMYQILVNAYRTIRQPGYRDVSGLVETINYLRRSRDDLNGLTVDAALLRGVGDSNPLLTRSVDQFSHYDLTPTHSAFKLLAINLFGSRGELTAQHAIVVESLSETSMRYLDPYNVTRDFTAHLDGVAAVYGSASPRFALDADRLNPAFTSFAPFAVITVTMAKPYTDAYPKKAENRPLLQVRPLAKLVNLANSRCISSR